MAVPSLAASTGCPTGGGSRHAPSVPFGRRRRAQRAERGASQVRGRCPAKIRSAATGAGHPGRRRLVVPRQVLTEARRPTAGFPVLPECPVFPELLDRWEAAGRPGLLRPPGRAPAE
jgi:hypothetical protein